MQETDSEEFPEIKEFLPTPLEEQSLVTILVMKEEYHSWEMKDLAEVYPHVSRTIMAMCILRAKEIRGIL